MNRKSISILNLALILGSTSTLPSRAENPVTAQDIETERNLYTQEVCWDKIKAWELATQLNKPQTAQLALRGLSRVEEKLRACTPDQNPPEKITAEQLPQKITDNTRILESQTLYLTRIPKAYQGNIWLDTDKDKHPEQRLTLSQLKEANMILQFQGSMEVPAILSEDEVIEYIKLRKEQSTREGSYYKLLHSKNTTFEELKKLRYFDYADSRPEKRTIEIFKAILFEPQTDN